MATAKKTTTKKTTAKSNNKGKWATTGGAMKPVDLSKIEFVNKPKK